MSSLNILIRTAKRDDLIITPRLNTFLMRNPNLNLKPSVADIINQQIRKQARIRSGSFSSSASGKCPRLQVFNYIGAGVDDLPDSNDPQLQQIFNDGTWRHLRWQATLLQAGILNKIEVPLSWKSMRSEGSMDGEGIVHDGHPRPDWRGLEFGFELKGMNSWGYEYSVKNGIKEGHLDQIHRYFLSGGHELFVVIYENKNTQEWIEWVITPDAKRMKAQEKELKNLNSYVDREVLPPMLPECGQQKGKIFNACPAGGKGGLCVTADSYKTLMKQSQWQASINNPQLGG